MGLSLVIIDVEGDALKFSSVPVLILPQSYEECVDYVPDPSSPDDHAQQVQQHCLNMFVTVNHTVEWRDHFTESEQSFIDSIFRKLISESHDRRRRRRRRDVEADKLFKPRERKEIRDPPYSHYRNFALAVRRLKRQRISSEDRNAYDTIAYLHVLAARNAHQGPAFITWHRLFLIMMETALGTPIPYWNSMYDYYRRDPTLSCVWTHKYFGNQYGYTRTGPFSRFRTPLGHLFRNVGSAGSLINMKDIKNVLAQARYRDIVEPTAKRGASLEGIHAGTHIYVDGLMNNIEYSPFDPVFFCHHAFTDYIYEVFRNNQRKRGINPAKDYPDVNRKLAEQAEYQPAAELDGYTLGDGMSEEIASLVKYINGPRCPDCSGSPDLRCRRVSGGQEMCVSRSRRTREYSGHRSESIHAAAKHQMMDHEANCDPFAIYETDPRVRNDSVTENAVGMTYASLH